MASSSDTRSKIGGWPLAAAIGVVLVFLFFVRDILLPFILAAAIAFALTPAIDCSHQRLRLPRWLVATLGYFIVLAVFGLLGYWVGGLVIRDVAEIVRQFPQLVHKLVGDLANTARGMLGLSLDADALSNEIVAEAGAFFGANTAMKAAGLGITAVVGTVLAMVLLIYFLISGKHIAAGVFWLVPPQYRRQVDTATAKILPMLWRYLVGLITVVAYTFAMDLISFWLVFRIPHAVLLAIVVGLLEMIPVIGPALSICLIVVSAIRQSSLLAMAGLVIFAVALRISIDQLVGPLVLGRAAKVHPVVIISPSSLARFCSAPSAYCWRFRSPPRSRSCCRSIIRSRSTERKIPPQPFQRRFRTPAPFCNRRWAVEESERVPSAAAHAPPHSGGVGVLRNSAPGSRRGAA